MKNLPMQERSFWVLFFIFLPIFHISTLFSYIASDHDESTYVELFMTSWFGSLISNCFTLDWFLRISNLTLLRLFTVRVFSLFCTRFFRIFTYFFKFPPIFSNFHLFFIFPPMFSYIAQDHVYEESTYFIWRHGLLILTLSFLVTLQQFWIELYGL